MEDALIAIGGTVVGTVIGFGLSLWQSSIARKRNGRDAFLTTTGDMRAKLGEMRSTPGAYFEQSVPILRQAIYRVRPFAKDWSGLEEIWLKYESTDKKQFSAMMGAMNKVKLEGMAEPQDLRDSYERLRDDLDGFESHVA